MMRTAAWATAVVIDALGVLLGFGYLSGGLADATLLFWGSVVIIIFGALLAALLTPRRVTRIIGSCRIRIMAAALCIAVPVIALMGSLDVGIISGQEWFTIFVAGLVGMLNWAAFK